jgi:hypothetical protein
MCDECVRLDGKIKQYRRLALRLTDPPLIRDIKEVIAKSEAVQLALHELRTDRLGRRGRSLSSGRKKLREQVAKS